MSKKVGVSREEMALPYYKYFTQPLAEVPAEKLAVLAGGASKIPAVPFDRRNLFLRAEDGDYCRLGYGVAEDGTAFVCNETYMPGVTGEMLDWWFPWHSVGSDLRYKIWDPEDHYFARADRCDYVCDPAVPMHRKTWGVNHYIMEDVGPRPRFPEAVLQEPRRFRLRYRRHRHRTLPVFGLRHRRGRLSRRHDPCVGPLQGRRAVPLPVLDRLCSGGRGIPQDFA